MPLLVVYFVTSCSSSIYRLGPSMSKLIRVFNLRQSVSAQDLANYFSKFGNVKHAAILFDMNTGFSKCRGHIEIEPSDKLEKMSSKRYHTLDGQRFFIRTDDNEDL